MLKYFYTISFFVLFFISFGSPVEAANYCHLYVDNSLYDTVTMPFYFHTNTMTWEFDISGIPHAVYTSSSAYISTATECENIKRKPIEENFDVFEKFNITYYNYTQDSYDEEYSNLNRFQDSVFTNSNTTIKGIFSLDDLQPPVFSNYLEKYTTNINNPIKLETILSSINVYDKRDGNVNDTMQVTYDNYSNNLHQVGTYLVILTASDYSNNTSSISIYIEVIDTTPPIIEGINFYTTHLSNPLSLSQIKDNLFISDNSNNDLNTKLYIHEDTYSSNYNTPGIYFIHFYATDLSNNISDMYSVTIEVIDDLKPTIEGKNYYTTSISNPLPAKNIMYSLIAIDNIDENLSSSIYIYEDLYSPYQNTIGEKSIYFQVMDANGNASEPFEVIINIVDDISPMIYGLNVFSSYLSNPLSLSYIKQQLTILDNYDGDISNKLELIEDSYTNNINNQGTYHLTFQAADSSLNISEPFTITITTIDDVPPTIQGPNILQYEFVNRPNLNEILYNYNAFDNIDNKLEIIIDYDTYSNSSSTGTYYMSMYTIDSNNNQSATYKIQIEIKDMIINTNEATIYLPTKTLYSIEEITKLINLEKEYFITSNTYTDNYHLEGSYTITYKFNDSNYLNLTVITYPVEEPILTNSNKEKKETFLDKIKSFFINIWNSIKNFFLNLNIFLYFYK